MIKTMIVAAALTAAAITGAPDTAPDMTPRHVVDPVDMGRYHAAARLCTKFALELKPPRGEVRKFLADCYIAALPRA
jgi:hypothetical protein